MDRKKVIIATPHLWDAPYKVGSHQYAKCFSNDGWDVAYISTPISPFHILYYWLSSQRAKVLLPPRWKSWVNGGVQAGNIWTYVPFGLIGIANTFFFNSDWALRNAGRFLIPSLKKKLKEKGFGEVHTIWLDNPLFEYLLQWIPHEISVLRIADDLSGFPELGGNILNAEKRLIQKVDLVAITSRSLEAKVRDAGAKRVVYLPNGVDFDHFVNDTSPEPEDLKKIPQPRVIYVGTIERWFDDKLVAHAALSRNDVSFVIIGYYKKGTFPSLEELQNVFLLGKRDYRDIPSYLKHSQVGMIPFKRLLFIDSVSPIKLYEYMSCRLPVVATRWKTLEEIGSPAFLAETEEDFLKYINEAMEAKSWVKDTHVKYASKNSWRSRFKLLKRYILDPAMNRKFRQ